MNVNITLSRHYMNFKCALSCSMQFNCLGNPFAAASPFKDNPLCPSYLS